MSLTQSPEVVHYCSNCDTSDMVYDKRNVTINRKGLKASVENIVGYFCNQCDEIDFDDNTDYAQRYADAGDKLVLQDRGTKQKETLGAWQDVENHQSFGNQPESKKEK